MNRKERLLRLLREELKHVEDKLIEYPHEKNKMKSDDYMAWVRSAESDEERDRRRAEYHGWYSNLSEAEKTELREHFRPELEKLGDHLRVLQGIADLALKGSIHYEGEEYLLGEWVTIADYARLHNLKLNRVTNWIKREVIPAENVKVFPALNNLRLVRNEAYRTGA